MPSEKITTEYIYKKDLDIIFEVNKKAVEIQTEVTDQNEEIIEKLAKIIEQNDKSNAQKKEMETKLDKLIKQGEETSKDLFKFQLMMISGFVAIVLQVVSIFLKK